MASFLNNLLNLALLAFVPKRLIIQACRSEYWEQKTHGQYSLERCRRFTYPCGEMCVKYFEFP